MKILSNILLILIFAYCCFGQENTNIRKDIRPFYSTRADVEKIATFVKNIGGDYDYETENEELRVYYSQEKCVWHGWNVAKDTVISYIVHPKKKGKI